MDKQHIRVYADPETKRRVELAAAKHQVSVTEYCLDAIQQRLADDELPAEILPENTLLETKEAKPAPSNGVADTLIADLRALHDRILARRGGQPIDMDILEQVRDEREDEILGLY